MNIFELTAEWQMLQDCLESCEDGDIEELLRKQEQLDMEIADKADGYARVIKNYESDIEGLKHAEKELERKRKHLENAVKRMKDNLQASMIRTGKTKFKTQLFSFGIVNNGGKAPLIINDKIDPKELPEELRTVIYKPDAEAIRSYIEETGDITYGEIGERGQRLSIK